METLVNGFHKARKFVFGIVGVIITFIYNAIFSKFISAWAYQGMASIMENELPRIKKVLDVGVGTGMSLFKVVDKFDKDT